MTGSSDDALSIDDLLARGDGRTTPSGSSAGARSTPDDTCTFIYTSGTTGPPKGCVISHGNYRAMLDMVHVVNVLGEDEVTYLYLPLAHSFALLIQFGTFDLGATLAYWERDPLKILPNLAEVQPTYFPSVPRIFEKIYTAATANADKEGGLEEGVFWWAIGVGAQGPRGTSARAASPASCCASSTRSPTSRCCRRSAACSAASSSSRSRGAAPINPDILRFFDAAGVLVLEGWGMTETSTAATIATPEDFKFGTIGKPFPGCEIKIADDGEILVKGPNVFQGYYKNEEATRETIVDGWLHTGDIGEFDSDGYLKITGRKKDIIITAGRQEHHPREPRGRDQAAPAGLAVRGRSATAGPTSSRWSRSTPRRRRSSPPSTACPTTPRRSPRATRSRPRSQSTSRRSTRSSPASSRSRSSRSCPPTSRRRAAS